MINFDSLILTIEKEENCIKYDKKRMLRDPNGYYQPSFESVNNNHWDLLASSFYHTLYNSLPFRLLVLGNQNLSSNYYIYYFSPIYTNLKQYSITNLLLAYTLPLLYIFSPTLVSSKYNDAH